MRFRNPPETYQIDEAIEEARRVHADLETKIRQTPSGWIGLDEAIDAGARLKALRHEKRRIVAAGITDEVPTTTPQQQPARSLSAPSRVSVPGGERATYEQSSALLRKEGGTIDDVVQSLFDLDGVASVEDDFANVFERMGDKDAPRAFTQAFYIAIVRQFAIDRAHSVGAIINAEHECSKLNSRIERLEKALFGADGSVTERFKRLHARIRDVEESGRVLFVGDYQAGRTYKRGAVTVFEEQIYFCIKSADGESKAPTDADEWMRLGAAPGMTYCGLYDPVRIYSKGDVIASHGSMFVCTETMTQYGGQWGLSGHKHFHLAVRRGRDRDSRRTQSVDEG